MAEANNRVNFDMRDWKKSPRDTDFIDALRYRMNAFKDKWMRSKEIKCPDHGNTLVEKSHDYFECSIKNCNFVMNMASETNYSFSYMIKRMNDQKQHDQDGVYVNGKFYAWEYVQNIIAKIKTESSTLLLTEEQQEFNSKAVTFLYAAHGCNLNL